jgi:serine protease Do
VNTAIFSPSGGNIGIGFAVPSRLAQHVVAQLKEHGRVERGWLGVSMQRLDPEMAAALSVPEAKGAVVAAVEPNSPAARAGLQPGDVIVGVNGRPIDQPRALAAAVAELKPGAETKLAVLRNGERTEPQVTIGTPPGARMAQGGAAGQEREQLGLALAPNGKGEGAVVAQVAPDGLAAERGMQPGDVILRAGGQVVHGPVDVARAVDAARQAGRSAIALQIEREGGRAIVALPLRTG